MLHFPMVTPQQQQKQQPDDDLCRHNSGSLECLRKKLHRLGLISVVATAGQVQSQESETIEL